MGSVGVVGLCLAMPALADATSGAPTSTSATSVVNPTGTLNVGAPSKATGSAPLSQAQKDDILDFLADHPQLGQALATRAQGWEKFVAANPTVKAELDKVLSLPADQRRAELQKWLAANPAAKQALQTYRQGVKQQRLTKQRDRLDQRIKRLQSHTT